MESREIEGFEAVYRECRDDVYRTAFLITRSPETAEDIAQETFVRYFVCCRQNPPASPGSWLMVVARNLAYNHLRHVGYESLYPDEGWLDRPVRGTEEIFFENMWRREKLEYTGRILAAVRARNRKWYDAMICAYCMEMPRQEVADCMGITLDALMSVLSRAKKWIRKHYREEYEQIEKR